MADNPEVEVDTGPVEAVTERDAIADAVRSSIAQLKGDNTDEPPADPDSPPEAPVEAKAERVRNEKGEFAKAEKPDKATKSPEAPVTAAPKELPSTDNPTKVSAEVAATLPGAPPVGWTAEGKSAWNALAKELPTLPAAVQTAVQAMQMAALKRDDVAANGSRQWSDEKRQYEAVLAPVADMSKRYNVHPAEGIKRLVAANEYLERDAPSALVWLAKSYGVDLAQLASNPPAPQPQVRSDPLVPQLQQQLSNVESQLQGFLQKQTLSVVDGFAKANPHFNDVERELVRLIPMVQQAEPGLSPEEALQKAYDQAIWLNPDVRSKIIAEQQAASQQARADQVNTKSAQAKKAAVSIKGSSNGGPPQPKAAPSGGDVYDDVRAAMAQLSN